VTPLIGREHELDLLDRAIGATVRRGRAQLLLVVAEAGMGKTRLAEEAASRAESCHNAAVFEGRCVPYGEANVWWPVAEALRSGIGLSASATLEEARERATERTLRVLPGTSPAEVERVVNGLLHLLAYDGPLQGIDPMRAREEARRSLVAYIEAFARQRPLIVVLSDLHWADDLVLELADLLLERVANLPFVLVATARDSLLERWQPRTGRHNLVLLNLDPLDREASGALLDAMVETQLPDELRTLLLDRSGGNPFFLEELVSLLAEGGVHDGANGPMGGRISPSAELPHTLRGLVAARLDALTSDERCVLEDAAVLGRRGPVFALEIMAEKVVPTIDVPAGIAGLVAKDVFVVDQGMWSFRSDLVREVAYGMLTKTGRARRHYGVASWMEQHLADAESEVDRIAHHYATAAQLSGEVGGLGDGDGTEVRDRAVHWLGKALHEARASELHLVAMRLCTQALEMVPPLEGAVRRRFLLGRARAATNLRDLDQAKADLDEAMGGAVAGGDEPAVAEVLLERGELEQKLGDLAGSAETLRDATERFRAVGDRRGEAESLRAYGMTRLFADDAAEAAASFTEALAIFRELGDQRGVAWALQNLAWVAYTGGDAELAEQWLEESIAVFTEIGDSGGLGWATGLLAFVRYHQGRFDDAEALAERMLLEAVQRGDRWAEGMMRALLALLALWTGRAETAVEQGEKALAVFRAMHDWYGELLAAGALGRSLLAAGRVDDGFNVLHEAMSTAALVPVGAASNMAIGTLTAAAAQAGLPDRLPNEPLDVVEHSDKEIGWLDVRIARNMLQLMSGSTDGVRASMEAIVERQGGATGYGRAALTLARAADHDGPGALAAFRELMSVDSSTYSDRITAMVGAGVAVERDGDHSASDALLRTAQDLIDTTEDRLLAAVVRLALARVAEHRGEPDATDALRRAHLSMSAMGVSQPGWDTLLRLILS
ncbi:MAG: hypothetical protein QOH64_3375, partial [Acidimicrobiaceae bacterium]